MVIGDFLDTRRLCARGIEDAKSAVTETSHAIWPSKRIGHSLFRIQRHIRHTYRGPHFRNALRADAPLEKDRLNPLARQRGEPQHRGGALRSRKLFYQRNALSSATKSETVIS